jgi:hypothetical protein
VIKDILQLTHKWVSKPADLARLAFGLVVGVPVSSAGDAADLLISQIPSWKRGTGPIVDFFAQLNRPRPSRVQSGLDINRLCKWQTVQIQFLQVAGGLPQPGMQSNLRAQLDMDVNTALGAVIPSAKVLDVITELTELAAEIVVDEDKP